MAQNPQNDPAFPPRLNPEMDEGEEVEAYVEVPEMGTARVETVASEDGLRTRGFAFEVVSLVKVKADIARGTVSLTTLNAMKREILAMLLSLRNLQESNPIIFGQDYVEVGRRQNFENKAREVVKQLEVEEKRQREEQLIEAVNGITLTIFDEAMNQPDSDEDIMSAVD